MSNTISFFWIVQNIEMQIGWSSLTDFYSWADKKYPKLIDGHWESMEEQNFSNSSLIAYQEIMQLLINEFMDDLNLGNDFYLQAVREQQEIKSSAEKYSQAL